MRQQFNTIIIGTNGTGKTSLLLKIISAYGAQKKRVLLLDNDGLERKYSKIDIIEESELIRFTGTKRLFIDDINFFVRFKNVFFNREKRVMFNGLLVDDDAGTHLSRRDEILLEILRRRRQANLDVITVFHGLSEVPPSLWTFCTSLILFKTVDGYERLEKNLPSNRINDFKVLVKKVNEHKSPFYFEELKFKEISF